MIEHELSKIRTEDDWGHGEHLGNHPTGIQVITFEQAALELNSDGDHFDHYFTPSERAYCQRRMPSYAARLAGKKAVMDVLGDTVPWKDISIESGPSEKPVVQLVGDAQQLADEKRIASIPISIAHDEGLAVAFAVGTSISHSPSNLSLGTDISSVRRIARTYNKFGDHFLRRVYTPDEAIEVDGNVARLAEKWAAKEAVTKALGTGVWREGIAWTDIAILRADDGRPYVRLAGAALAQAEKVGLKTWVVRIVENPETPLAFVSASS